MARVLPVLSYLAFWLILTEKLTWERFGIGLLVSLAVFWFNRPFSSVQRQPAQAQRGFLPRLAKGLKQLILNVRYGVLLVKEIFLSNIQVAKIVLSPRMKISPTVAHFKTPLKDPDNRLLLANSITLTPGTLTLAMADDTLTIHCLEASAAETLEGSNFEQLLLEKERVLHD